MSSYARLIETLTEPTTVAMLPASSEVASWDVRNFDFLTVQLENSDASQDFFGTLQRRLDDSNGWADVGPAYFATVTPGTSVVADCDVRGTIGLRLVGYMSGAGGDVRVTAVGRSASR